MKSGTHVRGPLSLPPGSQCLLASTPCPKQPCPSTLYPPWGVHGMFKYIFEIWGITGSSSAIPQQHLLCEQYSLRPWFSEPETKKLVHRTLTVTFSTKHWHHLHFKDEEPETQRGTVTQIPAGGEWGTQTQTLTPKCKHPFF